MAKSDYPRALRARVEALFVAEEVGAKKFIAKSLKLKVELLALMNKPGDVLVLMENALRKSQ